MSLRRFLAGATAVLWLAFLLRTIDLYSLPLYHDEGDHLRWSQFLAAGNPNYPLFLDGKFFLGVYLSRFPVNGPNSIWLARAAIASLSLLTCAASLAIGVHVGGRRVGWLAGLIYAILPLAAFYDRQIMADPLESAFGALAVLCALHLARSRSGRWVIGLGLFLALAFLSKFYGLLFFLYPLAAVVFFSGSSQSTRRNSLRYGAALGLAIVAVISALLILRPIWGFDNGLMSQQKVGHVTCPPILCQGNIAKQLDYFQTGLHSLGEFLPIYAGWPLTALALGSCLWAPSRGRRQVGLLAGATVAMLFGFSTVAYILPARYLAFLSMPLSVLGAAGGFWLADVARQRPAKIILAVALAAVNAWPAINLGALLTQPAQAVMPYDDRVNYIIGPISGTYMLQAARAIMSREVDGSAPPVLIFPHGFKEQLNQLLVHFDVTKTQAIVFDDVDLRTVGRWLTARTPLYIIDAIKADPAAPAVNPGLYPGLLATEIARYPHLDGKEYLRVQQVMGTDETLRSQLFAEFFIRPNEIPSTFRAVVASLPPQVDTALALYPPSQAAVFTRLLANTPGVKVYPVGDSWPLNVPKTEDQLAAIAQQHSTVLVSFLGETTGDPDRQLETWLNTHLFRVSETWFKPVRLLEYVSGGPKTQMLASDLKFGDLITLISAETFDAEVQPGGVLRLRLRWQTAAAADQQFKVFVHLYARDKIIAQHDGQAVGELRPTSTWRPGEIIQDQFAIRLPADAPAGDYQIRIGLYNLATQERLRLSTGEEFFAGGRITIP